MTRDEAKDKLMAETRNECTPGQMEDFIEMSVALGMLKLDEPESANTKFITAVEKHGFYKSVAEQMIGVMRANGLKIVTDKRT